MAGVLFPMTTSVEAAVRDVLSGAVEYVQLSIDTAKEIIGLEEKGRCALNQLPRKVPADKPRYIGKHQRSHDNEEKDDLLSEIILDSNLQCSGTTSSSFHTLTRATSSGA